MTDKKRTFRRCFYCEYNVAENDRLSANSITHAWLNYLVRNKREQKMLLISDVAAYEPDLMHLSCYHVIAGALGIDRDGCCER